MNVDGLGAYYDFQQLAGLRSRAAAAPDRAAGEVAKHFESLFMQMMLKSMREAVPDGGLFGSHQLDLYQGMFDQQVALHLSNQGALGLSEILVEHLEAAGAIDGGAAPETGDAATVGGLLSAARRGAAGLSADGAMPLMPAALGERPAQTVVPLRATDTPAPAAPATPEAFIRQIWDYAVPAAAALGVEPKVLVAQSALETGWGRKVIRTADGGSSHNLFGIKATGGWQGPAATVNTLEFRGGVAALERASFRVYDSPAGSFSDYVDLLTGSPRYGAALDNAADSAAFLRGLQDAGYATDPAYARKILAIVGDADYQGLFDELKNSTAQPLTSGEA